MSHTKGKWKIDEQSVPSVYVPQHGGGRLYVATVHVGMPRGKPKHKPTPNS